MASACDQLTEVASAGVGPALRAVDCIAGETTAMAFGRLFGAGGAMGPVLTILLTLYIAFFAISLLTGRSTLGVSALTPRMLTLGLVLTFATSWIAYQGVMWNLAVGGPDWIASVLTGTSGSATQIFGDRIDLVFGAIAETAGHGQGEAAAAGGQAAAAASASSGMFTPESIMWMGGMLLLLGTVGVLLTARIALAVLMALGPIFVVMALFSGTKGLTAGWIRGVALTAITPLFVVLGGSITLELLVPIVRSLSSNLVDIDGRAAMALFLVAAVHCALMVMVFKVAGTMVSGWQVFGLAKKDRTAQGGNSAGQAPVLAPAFIPAAAAAGSTASSSRRTALAAAAGTPVEVTNNQGEGGRSGERRAVVTQISGGGIEPIGGGGGQSRAKGIGSRFRASNDTAKSHSGRTTAKEMIR
ncbi:type IV secretion system protein VirB6 [Novosphingobium chloroacetimidivorans]|uniref:Type IV secretion system protein VirB6 n=1 Tax=Novosphingobium chloroacetimidivorans TaxID=1428314 RepID=A0A7W7KB02_9SPHN|nr:type IV secretion system protein [Novosphingobium chloroacetimidivorans]MBB4859497.1 type IV secretion system protein VirB6 [Novosphingobium chloroacetimidivorans]